MRTVLIFSVLVLGGCAVVPPSAWTFDPNQPRAKVAIAADEYAALKDRAVQLRIARDDVRARIAADRDVWQRQLEYEDLHRVGMQLAPIERRLAGVTAAR